MKIKVEQAFRDKFNPKKRYDVGKIITSFDEERCLDLINRGLASLVEDKKVEDKKEKIKISDLIL